MLNQIKRDPSSFKDPESWILNSGDHVIRRVGVSHQKLLARPKISLFLQNEVSAGRLIASSSLSATEAGSLSIDVSSEDKYLIHPRVSFVSYPYEWSANMLVDAARLTLDLQCGLLPFGAELKDSSAFNVLFRKGAPVFVDWGSFQTPYRTDSWYALGQFHRMFLYPIVLRAIRGWTPAQSFLLDLDGVGLNTIIKEIGKIQLLGYPTLWLDVLLPWLFERFYNHKRQIAIQPKPAAQVDPKFQVLNLRRLSRLISKLERRFTCDSTWHNYAVDCHYESCAESAKENIVTQFLKQASPNTVIDLGCNSGKYSRIAEKLGASVIAVDGDEGAISRLYSSLREEPANIGPVVINLANPSSGLGWCNLERRNFIQRGASDCAMALALVHHLRVTCNWPASNIVEFLSQLGRKHIIIEFVPCEDPMFQLITRLRNESYEDWNLSAFNKAMATKFNLLNQAKLPSSSRTISLWVRK